ncbi:MAG: hypothetical protein NPINA01_12780 [Nitrospinaceae bacterium]|nr:MAG: hypothetical protein NPINA01_12780 [Nitrospinaceae bacterium]
MGRAFLIPVIFLGFSALPAVESLAQPKSANCLKLVLPLDKTREDVQSEGGVWGIFSKNPAMNRHSSKAIAVDSKMSRLISTLTYLCKTRSGVPLNELASYVSRKVAELGEERFKNLHVTLGKPEKEIESWLVYTKIAKANRKRVLEFEKIKISIQDAGRLVKAYRTLFTEFMNGDEVETLLSRTTSLNKKVEEFFIQDPYIALAIFEESQVPFWDIDENYGGS